MIRLLSWMPMVTFNDAKDASAALVAELHPLSVMLFGSVAKEGAGNDLDLLIIVDDKEKIEKHTMMAHRALKRFYKKFAVDPFVIPFSLFTHHYSRGSPFLRAIMKEGRHVYMKDAVKEWLKQAEDERNMAAYLLQGGYFKGACYHAQQSAEKTLKALLLNKGWELEKIHSIERLVSIAETYKISAALTEEEVIFLDSIYRGRYPFEAGLLPVGVPSEQEANYSVEIAQRVLNNAKATLKVS